MNKKEQKDLEKIKRLCWPLDGYRVEWRTIGGISRATRISQERVSYLLLINFETFEFESGIAGRVLVRRARW